MASRKSKSSARSESRNAQQQQPEQTAENAIFVPKGPFTTQEVPPEERGPDSPIPPGARHGNTATAAGRDQNRTSDRPADRPPNQPFDTESVPDRVRERYVRIAHKLFLPNGDLAWEDHGNKLTTKSENREIHRDMFETSAARNWNEIEVTGTENFRRAMWEYATRAGIKVKGYEPTKFDEAELARSMGRRASAEREGTTTQEPPKAEDRTRQPDTAPRAGDSRGASFERVVRGTLVDHGAETYRFDPHEDMSYFVKIKRPNGEVETLWGLDLERALQEAKSRPQKGDEIVARQTGKEAVTVTKVERDGDGRVIGERDLDTHKNHWRVETRAFTDERGEMAATVRDRKVSAERAVEKFPSLAGTYAALREAELYAHQTYADPQARQTFQSKVREQLAEDIARGEPLVTARVRQPRTYERSQAPGGPAAPGLAPA